MEKTLVLDWIMSNVTESGFYPGFVRDLETAVLGQSSDVSCNFKEDLRNCLRQSGLEKSLRRSIYDFLRSSTGIEAVQHEHHPKEPLDYLRKAQAAWERRITKPLNSICTELAIPLTRKRSDEEQRELEEKWNELGTEELGLVAEQLRPVYAPKDFLDTLCRLRSPNTWPCGERNWNLLALPLKAKTLRDIKKMFPELVTTRPLHQGISDDVAERRMSLASHGYGPLASAFARHGCPQSVRGDVWCHILGVSLSHKERLHYEHLKSSAIQSDLMIDKVTVKDVKLTASNDDQYFVYEDYLYQVMLIFSRDREVVDHFVASSATPLKAMVKVKTNDFAQEVYPPSGIIPFHGFSMLIAPLCYVYDDPVLLYFVFRRLYTSYFFRLHTIGSHIQGILRLSLLFENLLKCQEPELCAHFQQRHIEPLRIAFKWLTRCFSGYLPVEEVLYLWDCVLAHDNLEIVAVLAAAIVSFRSAILRQIQSQQEAEAVFLDLSSIKVIPLLVHYLTSAEAP